MAPRSRRATRRRSGRTKSSSSASPGVVTADTRPTNMASPAETSNAAVSTVPAPSQAQDNQSHDDKPHNSPKPSPARSIGSWGPVWSPMLGGDYTGFPTPIRKAFPRQYDIPCGFTNSNGAQCYRNSIITALVNSDRFMAYVTNWHQTVEHKTCSMGVDNNEKFHLLNDLHEIGQAYWNESGSDLNNADRLAAADDAINTFWEHCLVNPSTMADPRTWNSWPERLGEEHQRTGRPVLERRRPHNQHQDADEFLGWLMDMMHAELADQTVTDVGKQSDAQDHFDKLLLSQESTRYICPSCKPSIKRRKDKIDSNGRVIHLNIPTNAIPADGTAPPPLTLERCFEEHLQGEREMNCDICEAKNVSMVKESKLRDLPEVLIVSLARFVRVMHPRTYAINVLKSDTAVQIPEILDVSPWLEHLELGSHSEIKYRLVSTILHSGELNGGHYVSIVRGGKTSDEWYLVNDHDVSPTTFDQIDAFQPAAVEPATGTTTRRRGKEKEARGFGPFTPYVMVYERVLGNEIIDMATLPRGVDEYEALLQRDGTLLPLSQRPTWKTPAPQRSQRSRTSEQRQSRKSPTPQRLERSQTPDVTLPSVEHDQVEARSRSNNSSSSNNNNPSSPSQPRRSPRSTPKRGRDDDGNNNGSSSSTTTTTTTTTTTNLSNLPLPPSKRRRASWQWTEALIPQEEIDRCDDAELYVNLAIGRHEVNFEKRLLENFDISNMNLAVDLRAYVKVMDQSGQPCFLNLKRQMAQGTNSWRTRASQGPLASSSSQ